MLALRVENTLLEALDHLAHKSHSSRSGLIRQAIARFLEDSEDIELANASLKKATSTKTLKQLRQDLELDSKI